MKPGKPIATNPLNAVGDTPIAVAANGLLKHYGKEKTIAVSEISFEIKRGEIFGLIGPDGAGKTSIFRMLTTLLLPDGGDAQVDGFDVVNDYVEIRKRVGYMPGKFSLYQDLTVEENIHFFATIFNSTLEENYHLVKDIYIQLEPFKNRKAGKLSGGMKQKLALCCALIHKPSVLFLDEPTTGVDPVSRKEFWEMLKRLKSENITIMVSTPYMDEANLCDRIALIQKGHILSIDTPQQIIDNYDDNLFKVKSTHIYHLLQDLTSSNFCNSCFTFGEYLHVSFKQNDQTYIAMVKQYLKEKQHQDIEIAPIEATIEDCFIKLLGNQNERNSNSN